MEITAVIMAGGRGERLWPKSRVSLPKQFLSMTGTERTMIQETVARILPFIPYENIYIVTGGGYLELARQQLSEIPANNFLVEPCGRNTAPCIAFAAAVIGKRFSDAVMLVLPSDHIIKSEEDFRKSLDCAISQAQRGEYLTTIGIEPTYAETGYGYIKYSAKKESDDSFPIYPVEKFVEKPELEKAKHYISCGNYLWNSGMFAWKVSTIAKQISLYLPDVYEGLLKIRAAIGTADYESAVKEAFDLFPGISIDYGIMEKADNVFVVRGSFCWDDVGSWSALERVFELDSDENVCFADAIMKDVKRSIIVGEKRKLALIGVEDLVVVDTPDVLLICRKDKLHEVRNVLQELREQGNEDLL